MKLINSSFILTNCLPFLSLLILIILRSINFIKSFYGNDKDIEFIVSELLMHGSLEMSSVLLKLAAKKFHETELKTKSDDLNQVFFVFNSLATSFGKLAEDKFIERLPMLYETYSGTDCQMQQQENYKKSKPKVPQFVDKTEHEACFKQSLPTLNIEGKNLKSAR
jgi:hypothetical protein